MHHGAINSRNACILVMAALLAACSGIPRQQRDNAQLERYLRYAGPPVDHITYLGRYDGWESLGQYQLVVWTGINDAYLITVLPPCQDLQFTQRIGLTSTAHTVNADYLRMRQDMRAEHAAQKAQQSGSKEDQ